MDPGHGIIPEGPDYLGTGAGYRSESYLEEARLQVARPTARETSGNRRPPYYTHVSLPYGRQGSFQLVDCCLCIKKVALASDEL